MECPRFVRTAAAAWRESGSRAYTSGSVDVTLRGIRGAVQVSENTAEAIEAATSELLLAMVARNRIDPSTMVAIWFTQTCDLTAAHAPAAARALGWSHVPLLGAQEAAVESMARVVRALVLAPLEIGIEARHVFLGATRKLRPDLEPGDGW